MRPSTVALLYWTRLRHRLPQELLAVLGIAVGVALVFAALIANTSLTGSVREITKGVVGKATIQVTARGTQGIDESLLGKVRALAGVDDAAAVLETRANLLGPRARKSVLLVAGDQTFSGLGGTLLPQFKEAYLSQQRSVGLPQPLADELGLSVGQPVPIEVNPRTVRVPFGSSLHERDIGALTHSPVALMSLDFAQRMTGLEGRVSRIFVRPEPGADELVRDRLRRLVGDDVNVVSADADVAAFERAAYPTNRSTTVFSVFSALVGFLFAFSAMLLTVPQRQRLVADLQMAGQPPWVLLQVLLVDALMLGIVGSSLGLALGDRIADAIFGTAPDYLTAAFPVGSQQIVTFESVAIAVASGLLAAVVAVLVPVRDVITGHPLVRRAASAHQGSPWRFAAGGTACSAIAVAVVIMRPQAAIAAIASLALALMLFLPLVLRGALGVFSAVTGDWRTPIPTLASYQLRSPAVWTRALALTATAATAVFATVAIGGANADLQRGLQESARDIDGNADIWVTFAGRANTLGTTAFDYSPRTRARILEVRGVADVRAYRGGFLDIGDRRAWVLASPRQAEQPVPPSQVRVGDAQLASQRIRQGGWVALSEGVADDRGVSVGDRVTLPSPVPTDLRVAAITSNLAWPPGAVVLNSSDYARAWNSSAVSAWQVEVEPGASAAAVARSIERVLGPRLPLTVETSGERVQRHYATARNALARLRQISIVVVLSAILALAAAMGGMIWQRRPEIAQLKMQGYPRGELWRLVIVENALLLSIGSLVGATFGLIGQVVVSRALETVTGFPLVYTAAIAAATGILGSILVLAIAMLTVPGWLAVQVPPDPDPSTS